MRRLIIGKRIPGHFLTGAALFALSAALRYNSLAQTPFANGWDGYFYLVQLKSWVETGRMHSPEASLIYPYLRAFYWLTGDYVTALKLGASILAGLFTWTIYALAAGSDEKEQSLFPAVLLASFSVFSPQLTYFAAQFPKNLLGVILFTAFAGSLSRLRDSGEPRPGKTWILPAILLIINYFGHRMTFVLAVMFLAFRLLFVLWRNWRQLYGGPLRVFVWLTLAGSAAFVVAGQFFPRLFHISDFGRLDGVFSPVPKFAPWAFAGLFGRERLSGWWVAEIAFATACWVLTAARLLVRKPRFSTPGFHLPLWCLCTLMIFPFLEWSLTGIAYRLFLVFVLITPLLVIDLTFVKNRRTGVIFAAFLLISSFFSRKSYQPRWHDPDYGMFSRTTANARQYLSDKSPELIIAQNGLAEFFTFTTGTDAMPWLPEYAIDSSRLWRIAAEISPQTVRYYAGTAYENEIKPIGYRYVLLPEYVWQVALNRARQEKDEGFLADAGNWRNPSRIRPVWLLHRNRKY